MACLITVLPISDPDRNFTFHNQRRNAMPMLAEIVDVVIGVDTHKHLNTAAVVDANTAGELDSLQVGTTPEGHQALLDLAKAHGGLRAWAIEGTNSYGAGLARFLAAQGEWVIEVDRPQRSARPNGAKSDRIDAARAAREALGRDHLAEPRRDGQRAALAARLAARRLAVSASADGQRQLQGLIVTAPEPLRAKLRNLKTKTLINTCLQLPISTRWDPETKQIAAVLKAIAKRINTLNVEAKTHAKAILELVKDWRPDLLELQGVGPIVAATILCAWSHPGRVRNDAAFAMIAGTAPIPASSGKTNRHRLNRSGDRHLNQAIHTITLTRMRNDPQTLAYTQRRSTEGKTRRETQRCLKRFITRQIFKQLENPPLDRT